MDLTLYLKGSFEIALKHSKKLEIIEKEMKKEWKRNLCYYVAHFQQVLSCCAFDFFLELCNEWIVFITKEQKRLFYPFCVSLIDRLQILSLSG